jgi:hypothetical protein
LIGPGWQNTFDAFIQAFEKYIPLSQRQWLSFAKDEETAVQELAGRG